MVPPSPISITIKRVVTSPLSLCGATYSSFKLHGLSIMFTLLSLTISLLLHQALTSTAHKLGAVVWDHNNPIFHVDNTDHVLDVRLGDIVDIVCSKYQYHIIYMVSEDEYRSCRIDQLDGRNTRKLLTCRPQHIRDHPRHSVTSHTGVTSHSSTLTMIIRPFSPTPRGLEFLPGKRYYFMSPSDGTLPGLHNQDGGSCQQHHLKLVINVRDKVEEKDLTPSHNTHVTHAPTHTETNRKTHWLQHTRKGLAFKKGVRRWRSQMVMDQRSQVVDQRSQDVDQRSQVEDRRSQVAGERPAVLDRGYLRDNRVEDVSENEHFQAPVIIMAKSDRHFMFGGGHSLAGGGVARVMLAAALVLALL